MRTTAYLICWFALWVDACLFVGVFFTGKFCSGSLSAVINFGQPISSDNLTGTRTIVILAAWTTMLANGWLYALGRSKSASFQFGKA